MERGERSGFGGKERGRRKKVRFERLNRGVHNPSNQICEECEQC
jgi:hypothetical protein